MYVGVAVDAGARVAYVSNISTAAVYRVAIGQKGPARYVGTVKGAERLGVVALDRNRRRLLAADARTGDVYALDLGAGASTKVGSLPGSDIRAFAVGPDGRRLYVADSGQEIIWAMDLDAPAPLRGRPLVRRGALEDPSGLAFDPKGRLWVTDAKARAVFRLSADGARTEHRIPW